MQHDKELIQIITINQLEPIVKEISAKYSCNLKSFLDEYIFLNIRGETRYIYFFSKKEIEKMEPISKEISSLGIFPYFIGGYFAMNIPKLGWEPQLDVGEILLPLCKNVVYLPKRLGEKFLYGKEISLSERFRFKRAIIVSESIFLGYADVKNHIITPITDLGWYLRSGH